MGSMVKLLATLVWGVVFFLGLRNLYEKSLATGVALVVLSLPLLFSATRRSLKLPPGPTGVPFLGYLPFLGELPHVELNRLSQKYGPVMHIKMGSFHGIVVNSPRLAKEVLMVQDHNFSSRPNSFSCFPKYFAYMDPKHPDRRYSIGTSNQGSSWRHLRRVMTEELQTPRRLKHFKSIRREEVTAMTQQLLEEVKDGKTVVDYHTIVKSSVMNNLTRMIIKKRYYAPDLSPEAKQKALEFHKLLTEVFCLGIEPLIQDFIPILRPVMSFLSPMERRMAVVGKEVDAFFQTILDEHRERLNTNESTQDFVDVMLQSRGEDNKPIDDRAIKAVTLEMFFAGAESTYGTAEWTMAELLHQPKYLRKLQEEIDAVVGTSRLVEEDDTPNLKFLDAVIHETLRLHGIAPLLLPHSNTTPAKLDGYDIPAGSHVMVNVWAIGRDPTIWDNPDDYNPDRFMTKHQDINYKGNSFELLPFGSGRRKCPGMASGVLMAHYVVARLVHAFNWSLPEGMKPEDVDLSEVAGINTLIKSPLYRVCCEPRLPMEVYHQAMAT